MMEVSSGSIVFRRSSRDNVVMQDKVSFRRSTDACRHTIFITDPRQKPLMNISRLVLNSDSDEKADLKQSYASVAAANMRAMRKQDPRSSICYRSRPEAKPHRESQQ